MLVATVCELLRQVSVGAGRWKSGESSALRLKLPPATAQAVGPKKRYHDLWRETGEGRKWLSSSTKSQPAVCSVQRPKPANPGPGAKDHFGGVERLPTPQLNRRTVASGASFVTSCRGRGRTRATPASRCDFIALRAAILSPATIAAQDAAMFGHGLLRPLGADQQFLELFEHRLAAMVPEIGDDQGECRVAAGLGDFDMERPVAVAICWRARRPRGGLHLDRLFAAARDCPAAASPRQVPPSSARHGGALPSVRSGRCRRRPHPGRHRRGPGGASPAGSARRDRRGWRPCRSPRARSAPPAPMSG